MSFMLVLGALGAGLASVLSPCVLPVLPIVAAGSEKDHKLRPLMLTLGLSLTFILMGILSSVAGNWLAPKMRTLEIISGAIIVLLGVFLLVGIDAFKHLNKLQQLAPQTGTGLFAGLLLGLALGLVWIPCVGPFLSSILAMVASQGSVAQGIFLLTIYSIGFGIPVLLAGYATQWFRAKAKKARSHASLVRIIGALLLLSLGAFIIVKGSYGLGSLSF